MCIYVSMSISLLFFVFGVLWLSIYLYSSAYFVIHHVIQCGIDYLILYSFFLFPSNMNFDTGWGDTRFEATARPMSLQHDATSTSRVSTGSSSESEAQSTISSNSVKSNNNKDKKTGMFRLFSKKKRSSQPN